MQHSASLEADLYGFNNWEPILNAVGQLSPFYKVHKEASSDNVIDFLIFSPENPNSILECINRARENARGVRTETIPKKGNHERHLTIIK